MARLKFTTGHPPQKVRRPWSPVPKDSASAKELKGKKKRVEGKEKAKEKTKSKKKTKKTKKADTKAKKKSKTKRKSIKMSKKVSKKAADANSSSSINPDDSDLEDPQMEVLETIAEVPATDDGFFSSSDDVEAVDEGYADFINDPKCYEMTQEFLPMYGETVYEWYCKNQRDLDLTRKALRASLQSGQEGNQANTEKATAKQDKKDTTATSATTKAERKKEKDRLYARMWRKRNKEKKQAAKAAADAKKRVKKVVEEKARMQASDEEDGGGASSSSSSQPILAQLKKRKRAISSSSDSEVILPRTKRKRQKAPAQGVRHEEEKGTISSGSEAPKNDANGGVVRSGPSMASASEDGTGDGKKDASRKGKSGLAEGNDGKMGDGREGKGDKKGDKGTDVGTKQSVDSRDGGSKAVVAPPASRQRIKPLYKGRQGLLARMAMNRVENFEKKKAEAEVAQQASATVNDRDEPAVYEAEENVKLKSSVIGLGAPTKRQGETKRMTKLLVDKNVIPNRREMMISGKRKGSSGIEGAQPTTPPPKRRPFPKTNTAGSPRNLGGGGLRSPLGPRSPRPQGGARGSLSAAGTSLPSRGNSFPSPAERAHSLHGVRRTPPSPTADPPRSSFFNTPIVFKHAISSEDAQRRPPPATSPRAADPSPTRSAADPSPTRSAADPSSTRSAAAAAHGSHRYRRHTSVPPPQPPQLSPQAAFQPPLPMEPPPPLPPGDREDATAATVVTTHKLQRPAHQRLHDPRRRPAPSGSACATCGRASGEGACACVPPTPSRPSSSGIARPKSPPPSAVLSALSVDVSVGAPVPSMVPREVEDRVLERRQRLWEEMCKAAAGS